MIDSTLQAPTFNQRMILKFESRVRHSNRISRCLYFYGKERKIIFSNGFIKKQQKTPVSEIEKANKLKAYYLIGE